MVHFSAFIPVTLGVLSPLNFEFLLFGSEFYFVHFDEDYFIRFKELVFLAFGYSLAYIDIVLTV